MSLIKCKQALKNNWGGKNAIKLEHRILKAWQRDLTKKYRKTTWWKADTGKPGKPYQRSLVIIEAQKKSCCYSSMVSYKLWVNQDSFRPHYQWYDDPKISGKAHLCPWLLADKQLKMGGMVLKWLDIVWIAFRMTKIPQSYCVHIFDKRKK